MAEEFTDFVVGKIRDADTVEDAEGNAKRILGVDAPESGTPAGEAATDFAKYAIESHGLRVKETGRKGYYGRDLVETKLGDTDTGFAEFLIRQGHARPVGGSEDDEKNNLAEAASSAARVTGLQDRGVQNPYDIDLSGETASNFSPTGGSFTNAVGRAVDNVQQLGYSAANVGAMALGDLFGTEVLDTWGEEGLRRNMVEAAMNPATIEKWDDVDDLSTGFTYVVETLGEQLPNIATLLGTGGVGFLVKGGASKLVQAGIQKKLAQLALKQGNKIQVAKVAQGGSSGFTAGVAAGSFGFGTGEIGNELRDAGIDSPVTALIGAVPFAALDTLGFQSTIGRLFRGIDKDIATQSVKDIARSTFKAAGVGAAAESSTEMLQEVITLSARAFHDPTFEIFSDENLARIKEAGIKAGIVGGLLGGGSTAVNKVVGKLSQPPAPPAETVEPTDSAEAIPPPAAAAVGVTTFPQRSTDYGYIPDEATVPAQEVFPDAPADAVVSIRGMLEQEIEPALVANENRINAFEALKVCLSS